MENNRAGRFRSNLTGEAEYKSFVPTKLPPIPAIAIDDEMLNLLVETTKELSNLDAISTYIPDMDVFVAMYVRRRFGGERDGFHRGRIIDRG